VKRGGEGARPRRWGAGTPAAAMNGGGARCGVAGGEGARRFVRGVLRIDAQLGGEKGKRRGKGKRRPGSAAGRGQEREAGG
jgi:hypothetical protein